MRVYSFPYSPSCRKVLLTMRHVHADAALVPIDLARGEQRSDAYLGVNPNGKVPALVDGELVLWESNAICWYLAGRFWPEGAGTSPQGRADIARWLFYEASELGHFTSLVALSHHQVSDAEQRAQIAAYALPEVLKRLDVIDSHLAPQAFLTGSLSIADLVVGASAELAVRVAEPKAVHHHLRAWLDRLALLPAWDPVAPATAVA